MSTDSQQQPAGENQKAPSLRSSRRRKRKKTAPAVQPGGVSQETLSVLEMDRVLHELCEYAASEEARALLGDPEWLTRSAEILQLLTLVQEGADLLEHKRSFSLLALADAMPGFKKLLHSPHFLMGEELNAIAACLELCAEVESELRQSCTDLPQLSAEMAELLPLPECVTLIHRMIDESGELKDSASPALGRMRGEFKREEGRIRSRLEKLSGEWLRKGWISDSGLGWRDGRPVVQVPAGNSGHIDGLVVDQSQSGRTFFVEPAISLEHRSKLNRLQADIRQEEHRLFRVLSEDLREHRDPIQANRRLLIRLDELLARARYALSMGGRKPQVVEEPRMVIRQGKHPLLMKTTEVVPLDLRLGPDQRVLVISGPNAGGKTVAMKTVGLFALMIRAGLLPPCAEGTCVPVFRMVLTDIGDQQSIENDLSTYSSHVLRMKEVLLQYKSMGLFLVDELGSGTDPEEGSAIAMSFLERMCDSPGLTIVSTHLGQLKAFAHDSDTLRNGSMSFDEESISPTYRFIDGVPGSSYALEILERMELPPILRDRARFYMGSEQKNMARLISNLQSRLSRSSKKLKNIEAREIELESLVSQYRDKMKSSKREAREIKREAVTEASTILKEANRLVDRTVKELKDGGSEGHDVRKARETIRQRDRELEKQQHRLSPKRKKNVLTRAPEPGDRVRLEGLEAIAVVVRADGKKLVVEAGVMKMSVSLSRVQEVFAAESTSAQAKHAVRHSVSSPGSTRLDLRGLNSDEAMSAVDAYIDECMISGLSPVTILHGKGDGILRRVVQEHLARFDCVNSFRNGFPEEGGDGVTIVKVDS